MTFAHGCDQARNASPRAALTAAGSDGLAAPWRSLSGAHLIVPLRNVASKPKIGDVRAGLTKRQGLTVHGATGGAKA
jgi:hypothetical protein